MSKASIARALIGRLSRGRLSILMFHRVPERQDPLFPEEIHADRFDALIAHLKRDWTILPLEQALAQLRVGTLAPGSVSITFDDGYADNATVALPILCAHSVTATFFVATGFLDCGRMWNDTVIEALRRAEGPQLDLRDISLGLHTLNGLVSRRSAIETLLAQLKYRPQEERDRLAGAISHRVGASLPTNLMMTSQQICELSHAGMTVGAHTVNHPILARLPTQKARDEIAGSKMKLTSILGRPVNLFAYPNGKPGQDYLPEHTTMVRELGFTAAVSTAWGATKQHTNLYELPRFTPWQTGRAAFNLAMARNLLRGGRRQIR